MHPNPPSFADRTPQRLTIKAPKPTGGDGGVRLAVDIIFEEIDSASEAVTEITFA